MSTETTSLGRILSFPEARHGAPVSNPPILTERRSKSRYPLELSVRFRLISGTFLLSGAGRTINLSAGGLLVVTQDLAALDEIGAGARLEISVEWPVPLNGTIPLQFLAVGRVVRRGVIDFAAVFERHQFRTKGSSSRPRAWLGDDIVQWPLSRVTGFQ